jgi:hypothetical protein
VRVWLGLRHPGAAWHVEVTPADEITCRPPRRPEQRIALEALGSVYVETNDSGPWGADVWWILNDRDGIIRVAYPQLATGEEAVLDRLQRFDDFRTDGMNSAENEHFHCWSRPQ